MVVETAVTVLVKSTVLPEIAPIIAPVLPEVLPVVTAIATEVLAIIAALDLCLWCSDHTVLQGIAIRPAILPEILPIIASIPAEVLPVVAAFLPKLTPILLERTAILPKVALWLLQLGLDLNGHWGGNGRLNLNLSLPFLTTLHSLLHHLRTGILGTLGLTLLARLATIALE